jgi:prolyl oligopeptidase
MISSGYRTTSTESGDRNDLYFQRLDPQGEITPIADDLDASSFGSDAGDAFIMVTNWQAPRRRVIRVEFPSPSRENWREIIPEGPSTIQGVATVGGKLVVSYLEEVRTRIRVFEPMEPLCAKSSCRVPTSPRGSPGDGNATNRFSSSAPLIMLRPLHRYDLATGDRDVWWRLQSASNLAQFKLRQVWYPSKDGTRIPCTSSTSADLPSTPRDRHC